LKKEKKHLKILHANALLLSVRIDYCVQSGAKNEALEARESCLQIDNATKPQLSKICVRYTSLRVVA